MKMSSLPKAFLASAFTRSKLTPTSSTVSQRRMPRPPPPAAAFRMTGKPNSMASFWAACRLWRGSVVPGVVGTPHSTAICLAESLSPIRSSTLEDGPMNLMPASSQARAKSPFSDKKAVAGVDGVGPCFLARAMIRGMSR